MSTSPAPLSDLQDAVAYFCMEFGLDERFPIYAGGLGILAGDTMKAAHDQQRQMVGIGIFWGEGYTIQTLDEHGHPRDAYVPTPRAALRPTGVEVFVYIRGKEVLVTAWRLDAYGNAPLLLLEPVSQGDRWISKRLYGGDADDRVAQEILLGVGGVRVLRALGIDVALYHFNEGHALFAGVELLREHLRQGLSEDEAIQRARKRVVFTTHTPVPAGNETHPMDRLLAQGVACDHITRDLLHRLGGDPFEMTPAALKLAVSANAVAQLHGATAREMWKHVPNAPTILSITNGVHMPTWQDDGIRAAAQAGDADALWRRHQQVKQDLIDEIALRNGVRLDPDVMLIGFARRAATYKRATLVLRDLHWLLPLLAQHKFQIVFSGKAHPRDEGGKALIQEIAEAARHHPNAIVFLDNYDMKLGRMLTRGCDVWLNTPRRPKEASGTSGMKAAANGILNLSILDGWWDEGCDDGVNGWQFGDRRVATNDDDDRADLADLQRVLTEQVIPAYEAPGRPRWMAMMQASIASSEVRFSAGRMVEDYVTQMYQPAIQALHEDR